MCFFYPFQFSSVQLLSCVRLVATLYPFRFYLSAISEPLLSSGYFMKCLEY